MKNNGEKRYMPDTNPDWDLELPDGDLNSLVAKSGKNWDNGYNFDQKDDDDEEDISSFDPEATERAKQEYLKQQQSQGSGE